MKENMKKSIPQESLVVSLAIFIILLVINSVIREIYIPLLNKDVRLKIVATSEAEDAALSNNVRVRGITVNGDNINLGKVNLDNQRNWKYESKHDFLYAYNLESREELVVELADVHNLSITFIEEVGSGCVEVYVNDELWYADSLYENTDWQESKVEYSTSVWVFPEANAKMMCLFYLLAYLLANIILRREYTRRKIICRSRDIIIQWGLANSIVIMAAFIQYQFIKDVMDYVNKQPKAFLQAVVLIFLILELAYFAVGKMWLSFISVALFFSLAGIVSQIKIVNRGIPLLPWDFTMFFEALSVAENYEIVITLVEIGVILLIFVISYFLTLVKNINYKYGKPTVRIIGSIIILITIAGYLFVGFIAVKAEAGSATYRVYQVDNYYKERGFITGFFECVRYVDQVEEPAGYNEEKMESIYSEIAKENQNNSDVKHKTPNIIAIMSESYWDVSKIDTITLEEELLPVYEELKKESMYGNLFTHVLGGGTVVSEFEFLTGFTGEFFPTDYMVYGNHLKTGFDSVVNLLEQQGYNTTAFHPYIASNYNRESAYEKLGFDKGFYDKDFVDPLIIRNYISDQALYDKMISEFEKEQSISEQPVFMFAVTMQNHGGYWENTIYEEGRINFSSNSYNEVAKNCISDYLAGLHESDRALGTLIDYFRNVDEDTIIIYFGDHVSDAGPNDNRMLEETSWSKEGLEYSYETHVVPFLVWSNFSQESKKMDIMEIGQLLPTVFSEYNIKSNDFWKFLVDLKQYYAATGSALVVYTDSQYRAISDLNPEQKKYYEYYQLIQYDYIWGKRYLERMWQNSN